MGGLGRRLGDLEARATKGQAREIPMHLRLHAKATERLRARIRGEEPPAYTQEEIDALREDDLADASGGGTVGMLRASGGWWRPEDLAILDAWEEGARRRIEKTAALPPKRWGEVYEEDDDEGEEAWIND